MVQTVPSHVETATREEPTPAGGVRGRLRPGSRRWLRAGAVVLTTAAIAYGITAGLEYVHATTVPGVDAWEHLLGLRRTVVLLGAGVVAAVVVLLHALTNRLWLAGTLTGVLAAVVAFADYQKVALREEPLFATDVSFLGDVGFLLDAVGLTPAVVGAAAVAVAAALVGLGALERRWRGHRRQILGRRAGWITRLVAAGLALAVLAAAHGFNEPGNPLRAAYDNAGALWKPWQQPSNYAVNGVVAGLLFTMPATAMHRPPGYSEQAMADLTEKYRQAALATNAERDAGALDGTNVVVVLGETFSDPLAMDGVDLEADPIPYTRALMESTASGTMLSSGYGGGTANVEFEVLTGMALANFQPQMRVPYQSLLATEDERFPSFVQVLGEDRATLAIHPYLPSFYQRDDVYEALGFDRATFIDDMTHRQRVGRDPHVADSAAFAELVDELRAAEEPVLAQVVTMQNHQPYDDLYDDPMAVSGDFPPEQAAGLRQYATGLQHTDEANRQLFAALEQLPERTIVLYYGDHLPAVWPQPVLDASPPQAQWTTPWFVWASDGTEPVTERSTLSPTFLVNQLLAAAGAPVTPLNALLEELSGEVGAYEPTMILDATGEPVTEAGLSPRAHELLADYRMVQYDLSVGERYAAEAMLTVP